MEPLEQKQIKLWSDFFLNKGYQTCTLGQILTKLFYHVRC